MPSRSVASGGRKHRCYGNTEADPTRAQRGRSARTGASWSLPRLAPIAAWTPPLPSPRLRAPPAAAAPELHANCGSYPPAPEGPLHVRLSRWPWRPHALPAAPRGVAQTWPGGLQTEPRRGTQLRPLRPRHEKTGITFRHSPWPVFCRGPGWGGWRKDSQNPSSSGEPDSYRVTTTAWGGGTQRRAQGRGPLRARAPRPAHAPPPAPLCARPLSPGPPELCAGAAVIAFFATGFLINCFKYLVEFSSLVLRIILSFNSVKTVR